ncbi:glycosyltransferase family 4 protein [uncultured Planktosalinus sp.]|uniref:glycosyltransferase family 4 protein n=1 Tax=uncultured Planktosalinus sp. TaxID=1810935 RepID=UPI0030DA6079
MLALKVIEELVPKYPEISLCMVGPEKDGSLKECKEYATFKQLPVTFTGKLTKEEWIKLSENFSIFMNTTNFDNTPVSVIEAMALGLTVVSTKVGGIPFLLEDRKDALLVHPDSVKAFVESLEELFANVELSNNLTQNARKKVENFDWDVVKYKWFEILN